MPFLSFKYIVFKDLNHFIVREVSVDNIYEPAWWKNEPEVKKWNISPRYVVQVRAKEFEYHPPHFHVISNEFEAVFKLSNGELYTYGRKNGLHKWFLKFRNGTKYIKMN